MILEFLSELTQAEYRIFSTTDAYHIARNMGIKPKSVPYLLRTLLDKKFIRSLFKGTYAIEDNILSGAPLHKFEIAMHLAKEGAIACWSAMSHYGLTDQVLSTVYVLAPYKEDKKRSLYKYHIDGYTYLLIQMQEEHYWGITKLYMGESQITITDLERTLIDGLIRPHYCGGIREVLNAFELAKGRLEVTKIIKYAKNSPVAVQKRLGWILDHFFVTDIASALDLPDTNYFDKLDAKGPRRGKQNKKWMLLENF